MSERDALRERLERYRGVTLVTLDAVPEDRMAWSPQPELFTFGQQFYHIFQAEDYYSRGLLEQDWRLDRIRMPSALPARDTIRDQLLEIRRYTLDGLDAWDDAALQEEVTPPNLQVSWTVRGWFDFVLEHEIHHRAQTALYLRLLGMTPPFYAAVLDGGGRPDIEARRQLDAGLV